MVIDQLIGWKKLESWNEKRQETYNMQILELTHLEPGCSLDGKLKDMEEEI